MKIHDEDGNLLGSFPFELCAGVARLHFFSGVDWPGRIGAESPSRPFKERTISLAGVPLWVCPAADVEALLKADRFHPAERDPAEVLEDVERYLWRTLDEPPTRPNFREIARRVVEVAKGDPLRPEDGGCEVAPPRQLSDDQDEVG